METASRILTIAGVCFLAYGFLLGVPLSSIRMRSPHASRHLVTAHLAAIIQGAVLLGLARAVPASALSGGVETVAAWLLVTGLALFALGATLNWLQDVKDHFAERSPGWMLLASSAPFNVSAIAILLAGIASGL